ncbi:MAG: dienelactone hydrolase family protein [Pseudomonadota bacterium]
MRLILAAVLALLSYPVAAQERVTFPAGDGLEVTADLYPGGPVTLVLFHMAGASRGEYREIAPRLVAAGYTVLAVDQRAGNAFGGVANETAGRAGGAEFADAIPDLEAAVAFARDRGAARVGALGSSYSAALVLVLSGRDAGFADAVMAFSPGEYFGSGDFVRRDARAIAVPVFITGAGNEGRQWGPIAEVIDAPTVAFRPDGSGRHGATALLSADGDAYWAALEAFLAEHLPAG